MHDVLEELNGKKKEGLQKIKDKFNEKATEIKIDSSKLKQILKITSASPSKSKIGV